jgi:hypothetical protein
MSNDPRPPGFFPRAISIVQLPDERWAVQNERDLSDLTREDLVGISDAFVLWVAAHDLKLKARQ